MKIELTSVVMDDVMSMAVLNISCWFSDKHLLNLAPLLHDDDLDGEMFINHGSPKQILWYYKHMLNDMWENGDKAITNFCQDLIYVGYIKVAEYVYDTDIICDDYLRLRIANDFIEIGNDEFVINHFPPKRHPRIITYAAYHKNKIIFDWCLSELGELLDKRFILDNIMNIDDLVVEELFGNDAPVYWHKWWGCAMKWGLNKYISDDDMKGIILSDPHWYCRHGVIEIFLYWDEIGFNFDDIIKQYIFTGEFNRIREKLCQIPSIRSRRYGYYYSADGEHPFEYDTIKDLTLLEVCEKLN